MNAELADAGKHTGKSQQHSLGGEAETVIKIYLALQTDGGKQATVNTVTQLKLSPDALKRFQELKKDIKRRYDERNKAAHGAWGISPKYPDDLLWYDPRESLARLPGLADPELLADLRTTIRIYTKRDFEEVTARFKSTQEAFDAFTKPYTSPVFAAIRKAHQTSRRPPTPAPEGDDSDYF